MNLTTLAHVLLWLPAINNTNSNSILNMLIANCSGQILAYLQRPNITQTTYTDNYDGLPPSGRVMLRNWPVLAVSPSGVMMNTATIPQSSGQGQPGWSLESWDGSLPGRPQRVGISWGNYYQSGFSPSNIGYNSAGLLVNTFPTYQNGGFQNLSISYTAGYVVQNEAQTGALSITPNQPYGIWAADSGVTYVNGTALKSVTSNPATGQYVPPTPFAASPNLNYTFAAGDVGASLLLSYSFIPFDLEQACIEWVGERFKYRDRIGLRTQTLNGQESISYMTGMPEAIKMMLEPYKKAFPL